MFCMSSEYDNIQEKDYDEFYNNLKQQNQQKHSHDSAFDPNISKIIKIMMMSVVNTYILKNMPNVIIVHLLPVHLSTNLQKIVVPILMIY